MQTPSDLLHSVLWLLTWLLDVSLVLVRLGVEWFRANVGTELITYLVKFITDSIILILQWVISASRWLLDILSRYKA